MLTSCLVRSLLNNNNKQKKEREKKERKPRKKKEREQKDYSGTCRRVTFSPISVQTFDEEGPATITRIIARIITRIIVIQTGNAPPSVKRRIAVNLLAVSGARVNTPPKYSLMDDDGRVWVKGG